jgi:hypothetical protein
MEPSNGKMTEVEKRSSSQLVENELSKEMVQTTPGSDSLAENQLVTEVTQEGNATGKERASNTAVDSKVGPADCLVKTETECDANEFYEKPKDCRSSTQSNPTNNFSHLESLQQAQTTMGVENKTVQVAKPRAVTKEECEPRSIISPPSVAKTKTVESVSSLQQSNLKDNEAQSKSTRPASNASSVSSSVPSSRSSNYGPTLVVSTS